jgi:hypothetical protein
MSVQIERIIGEVQTTPSANTVLDRLKQITLNTSSSGGGNYFIASNKIIRPNNGTPYAIGDIINANGITTNLPTITIPGGVTGGLIEIQSITIYSNFLVSTLQLNLYSIETDVALNTTDNIPFAPTSLVISKLERACITTTLENHLDSAVLSGQVVYSLTEFNTILPMFTNGASNVCIAYQYGLLAVYTPIANQEFTITIRGRLL